MSDAVQRVVFDCNIFAQSLITPFGNSGQCVERVLDGRISLFWSEYVLEEIRRIPEKPTPMRLGVTSDKVELLVARLTPVAHLVENPPSVYRHPIDPKDSHYVDLAMASNAKLIVSRDKHLLNLMNSMKPGTREFKAMFPSLAVLQPEQLLELLRTTLIDSLKILQELLGKHGHAGQANVVQKLIELRTQKRPEFTLLIQSVDMWGGTGAVWEVGSMGSDMRQFRQAIIDLAAAMDRDAIGTDRARYIASVFSDWNRRGL